MNDCFEHIAGELPSSPALLHDIYAMQLTGSARPVNEDQTSTKQRRTAAIWMAMVCAFLFTAGNLVSVVQRTHDFFTPALVAIGGASFVSLVFYPRSRSTYFITSIFFAVLVVRGFFVDVFLLLRPPAPGAPTQSYSSYTFNVFIDFLLVLLLWRYTRGARTRRFYDRATPGIRNT
jgi:FtsH-binding integral membrane protein